MSSPQISRTSAPVAFALCLLNWIIPGAGYILCKDYARGITLFVLINLCFAIGVFLGGYLLTPAAWFPLTSQFRFDPDFNFVSVLTYLSQFFHGGGWLLMESMQRMAADDPNSMWNIKSLATKNYSDLGVFHLIAAGALNYFATVRLYDLLAGNPELSDGSAEDPVDEEVAPTTAQNSEEK